MSTVTAESAFDDVVRICREGLALGLSDGMAHFQGAVRQNMGSEGGGASGKQRFRFKRNKDGSFATKSSGARKKLRSGRLRFEASPPGKFPAVRSGRLRQSFQLSPATPSELVAVCGTSLGYALVLEYGGLGKARDGTRYAIPARPFMLRTLNEESGEMQRLCAATATKYIGERAKGLLGGK